MENIKKYTYEEKRAALESVIQDYSVSEPFMAGLMQEINISYSQVVPTAAIGYDKRKSEFNMYINEHFFLPLSAPQRKAILIHEILHFSHGHLFRGFLQELDKDGNVKPPTIQQMRDLQVENIAADMAINQFIQNLPDGCVDYKNFKLPDGKVFPAFQTFETYKELLQQHRQKQKQPGDTGNPDKNVGDRVPGGKGEEYRDHNEKQIGEAKIVDVHDWMENLDDEDKQKLLQEAKKVLKRTIEKTSFGQSQLPKGVQDLLEELDAAIKGLDYKGILRRVIKKTVTVADRRGTWNRPNKRYGTFAKGTKNGELPRLGVYIDTSGSISHQELNTFLSIMDNFLRVGTKKCTLGLWHTELYYHKPYRFGQKFNASEVQSGGTTVNAAVDQARKDMHDLTIILTDGYVEPVNGKFPGEVVWIISEQGNVDHPNKHIGKTVALKHLK